MSGVVYALRFISGKYQGGEFPLKENQEIIIGRSSELDMVLVEDMVSRQHAKISTSSSAVQIQDLGSTNGTFVNGEKIKQARLKVGDRVLIGTSIIKLISADDMGSGDPPIMQTLPTVQRRTLSGTASMVGTIDEIPLPDLLQLLSTSKKSGVLQIDGPKGVGRIYLRAGQIYYAGIDDSFDLDPRKAFYRMVVWETGTFELQQADDKEFLEEISDSTEGLLMEAMRQLDEIRRLEPELPSMTAALRLASPMTAPLRDLSPDQLDLVQLVHNHSRLTAVLDKSRADDLSTLQGLLDLLLRGYVEEKRG